MKHVFSVGLKRLDGRFRAGFLRRRGLQVAVIGVVLGVCFWCIQEHYRRRKRLESSKVLPTWDVNLEPPREDFIDAVGKVRDENGVVVILSASVGYVSNVVNTMCSMKRVGITRALLVALDRDIHAWAKQFDFLVPVMLPGLENHRNSTELIKFGSAGFADVSMGKFMSVERVLATGATAVFSDGDIFYCRNPIPEMLAALKSAWPPRDILFQTSYESKWRGGDYINTGLFIARPTVAVRSFFLRTLADWNAARINNQRAVNNRLCSEEKGGRVVSWQWWQGTPEYCKRDGMRAGFLDPARFPNGPTRTPNALSKRSRAYVRGRCERGEVTALHGNYIVGKLKELRFRSMGLWYASDDNASCLASPAPRPIEELKACGRTCKAWLKDKTE